jgi:hypothetical protein
MGVFLHCVFSHSLSERELFELPTTLPKVPELTAAVNYSLAELHSARNWPPAWEFRIEAVGAVDANAAHEDWSSNQRLRLRGLGLFSMGIGPRAVDLTHAEKWPYSLSNVRHQTILRRACRGLAKLFKTSRAIYLPEMTWFGELDASPKEIDQNLATEYGEPAASLQQIYEARASDWWHPHCYYVDYFSDLGES